MNKRIKKKIQKRFGYKSYYNYRRYKTFATAELYAKKCGIEHYMILIKDTRKMDFKHVHKIELLINPVLTNAGITGDMKEMQINFTCSPQCNDYIIERADKLKKNINY